MKRALFAALIAAVICTFIPAHAQAAPKLTKWQLHEQSLYVVSAPGDEYFGHQKMSYLGINNVLRFQALRAGDHTTDPSIIKAVAVADEALHAWAKKYPRDPALARSYFLAAHVDKKIWVKESQSKAWQYMHAIVGLFPNSYFGKQVKKDLALGFTEHYYADPKPCPPPTSTPLPLATPTVEPKRGRHAPSAPPTTIASTEPTVSPAVSPTPAPTATPTPGANQPKVQIIDPPCVPATPTPSS